MVNDEYYPKYLVDKIKELIIPVISLLENGETNKDIIQSKLDEMTLAINELQEEFYDNDSEIETVARDSIAVTIAGMKPYSHRNAQRHMTWELR